MDGDKSNAIILEKEQRALAIIQKHMIDTLNSKICYKYDKKKDYPGIQVEPFQSFWSKCLDGYRGEIENYCMNYADYAELQETSDDEEDREEDEDRDDDEDFERHIDFFAISADIYDKCVVSCDEYADCYCQDLPSESQNSECMTELEVGEESIRLESPSPYLNDLDKAFLEIRNLLYSTPMLSEKCDKLYLELCKQLEKDLSRVWATPKVNLELSDDIFAYIPKILDLGNQDICSILPYLMTAYFYNAPTSRFFHEGKTLLKLVFGSTRIESDQAPKPRERIKKFCLVFSLSQAKLDSNLHLDCDSPRRKLGLSAYRDPGVILTPKDRKVLGYIFDYWCEKIPHFASDSNIDIKIDADLCEELLLHYMNGDS